MAELLIVVAIIAVLVAVAIPVFNNQLEKARESVDISNLRNAYAVAKNIELEGTLDGENIAGNTYYYDLDTNRFISRDEALAKYCNGNSRGGVLESKGYLKSTHEQKPALISYDLPDGINDYSEFLEIDRGGGTSAVIGVDFDDTGALESLGFICGGL